MCSMRRQRRFLASHAIIQGLNGSVGDLEGGNRLQHQWQRLGQRRLRHFKASIEIVRAQNDYETTTMVLRKARISFFLLAFYWFSSLPPLLSLSFSQFFGRELCGVQLQEIMRASECEDRRLRELRGSLEKRMGVCGLCGFSMGFLKGETALTTPTHLFMSKKKSPVPYFI